MYSVVFSSMASGHFILLNVSPSEPAVCMSMLLERRHFEGRAPWLSGSNDEVALQMAY